MSQKNLTQPANNSETNITSNDTGSNITLPNNTNINETASNTTQNN